MSTLTTTYTEARARLAQLLDEVVANREPVVIRRRGHEDVALIAASELTSLEETAHLLRSPANAARLQAALEEVEAGQGERLSLEELRRSVGLDPQK
ncbi:MAG TPA: type II toxin-antitoxin system prevent-host-death family antitoxin [Thermoanaerobaculia bacterium]|nr:type II toxin-antitoxin system prevent-host-death family antitoxin [Thermoanaerobaculia bacterium]